MCNFSVDKIITIITLQINQNLRIETFICIRLFQDLGMNEMSDKK